MEDLTKISDLKVFLSSLRRGGAAGSRYLQWVPRGTFQSFGEPFGALRIYIYEGEYTSKIEPLLTKC